MREHSSQNIKFESIGKNYYEITINNGDPILLERSEVRELIEIMDNTITF